MRIVFLCALGLIASLATASAQYYGPAANPPTPQQLNSPRGTYTQPFGTDPRAASPYVNRGNLNVNGYNPGNIASPYGQQQPLTTGGYSLGAPSKSPKP
jgi:hypothetical protein